MYESSIPKCRLAKLASVDPFIYEMISYSKLLCTLLSRSLFELVMLLSVSTCSAAFLLWFFLVRLTVKLYTGKHPSTGKITICCISFGEIVDYASKIQSLLRVSGYSFFLFSDGLVSQILPDLGVK